MSEPLLDSFSPEIIFPASKAKIGLGNRVPDVSGALVPCCSQEDVVMRTYDFSPLYRSTVGFDRLFDMLDRGETAPNWPPYNIERTSEDDYRITMALAAFSPA